MKILKTISLLLLSMNAFAASTTVNPFDIEFYSNKNTINIEAKLTLTCRYEKMVWSDSSEYYTEYKNIDLHVSNIDQGNGLTRHVVSLFKIQYLEVTGIFKPTKGCKSEIKLDIKDANYSVGWANQFSKPISFNFWNFKNYSSEDTIFSPSKLREQTEGKVFTLNYKKLSSQVNVTLLEDGQKISNLFIETAALNQETGMPFRIQ